MKRKLTALIDGDVIVYRFAYIGQEDIVWDNSPDGSSSRSHLEQTLYKVKEFVEGVLEATKATDLVMCISSTTNFRKEVMPTYKSNRKKTVRPLLYQPIRDFLLEEYNSIMVDGLEADDMLGILTTTSPLTTVCCSIDKDLNMIPGQHYNWNKRKRYAVIKADTIPFFYTQVLAGDPTDGYYGIPRVGPKTAEKILAGCTEEIDYWNACVDAYEAKGLTEEDCLQTARVAYILQKDNYNRKTKEYTLWQPPKRK